MKLVLLLCLLGLTQTQSRPQMGLEPQPEEREGQFVPFFMGKQDGKPKGNPFTGWRDEPEPAPTHTGWRSEPVPTRTYTVPTRTYTRYVTSYPHYYYM